jgi:6-phosphofructokinase 1
MPKILVCTGGGDCPGLNAVLRGIAKAAKKHKDYEIWGSKEAFNGVTSDPPDLIKLDTQRTAGIHVKGGTILKTTNKGNPLSVPVRQPDGTYVLEDRCPQLAARIRELGFDVVINIGGDGSQRISQALASNGIPVIGVPKTIDNDLRGTDLTFGFSTAVQVATDCFDKLVTTAESHHRVMIMEVMGRDAGWIALHTAIAGGAEICLIPEIHYDAEKVLDRINRRYRKGKGFINIVIAEGARPIDGKQIGTRSKEKQDEHIKLGGIGVYLRTQLEELGCEPQIRTAVLGHIQRGGTPIAYDRILASAMGVRAFEMARDGEFNRLVSLQGHELGSAPLSEAAQGNKFVDPDHFLVRTARSLGIEFGD